MNKFLLNIKIKINRIMAFKDVFKDNNEFNEKNIIGFLSFSVMVITSFIDLGMGVVGLDLVIHEYIYNSFVIVTLGSFGIAGVEKFAGNGKSDKGTE